MNSCDSKVERKNFDLDADIVESLVEGGWSRKDAEAELQALKEWASDDR